MELAIRQVAPEAEVRNIDVLPLTNAVFRRVYGQAYLDLVNRAPHLLGYIYDLTDVVRKRSGTEDRLRRLVGRLNLSRVIDLLEQPWDVVVNTHFLPAEIIATLRRRKKSAQRHVTVVTDFDAHAFWVNQPTDRYYVATEEAGLSLEHWGVPAETIRVTGIPIHPVFATPKRREDCAKRQGLRSDRPIVLLLAGGFGVGPIEKIFGRILEIERPLQVAVVAGKNAALKGRLDEMERPARHAVSVIGFTTEIDELMAAADIVVTKPGGLTTSEVLARGSVMAIMNPIPGQESRNSDYLLEHGAAVKINTLAVLKHKLSGLLDDPGRMAGLKKAAASLGHPGAAFEIARDVLKG